MRLINALKKSNVSTALVITLVLVVEAVVAIWRHTYINRGVVGACNAPNKELWRRKHQIKRLTSLKVDVSNNGRHAVSNVDV